MSAGSGEHVAIVGGGIIGLAATFELATRGLSCTLIDPTPGAGASWAAAGMLAPAAEVAPGEEALQADLLAAGAMWPTFADRLYGASGVDVCFDRCGSVLVGATQSDAREVARLAGLVRAAGGTVSAVSGDEITTLEPALATRLRGAWLLEDDHRVDNRQLVRALQGAARAAGARILEDRCTAMDLHGRRVELRLEHLGEVQCDQCVIAIGASAVIPGTEALGGPTIRPVRGVTLRLGARPGVQVPTRTVRGFVDGMPCYLVPRRDGSIVVGATSEERGGEAISLAGGVRRLLDAAHTLFPAVDELAFEEASVGLRPATDDHLAFVGRTADSRVIVAAGHYRNGVLLAPLAATQVANLVEGDSP